MGGVNHSRPEPHETSMNQLRRETHSRSMNQSSFRTPENPYESLSI